MALGSSPRLDIIMALSGKKASNISLHLTTPLLLFFLVSIAYEPFTSFSTIYLFNILEPTVWCQVGP